VRKRGSFKFYAKLRKGKLVRWGIGIREMSAQEKKAAEWVAQVFAGKETKPPFPLKFTGLSPIEKKVIEALRKIPEKETVTYKELARMIGRPRAWRAVARAMSKNPFPFYFPCHRVVRSDGLGEYRFGKKMKKELLKRERAIF